MVHDSANWLIGMRRTALALTAAALSLACAGIPAVHAQSVMRSPNFNVQSRMPTINPTVRRGSSERRGQRAGRRHQSAIQPRIGVTSTLPNARFSPNLSPACSYAHRDSSGECQDKPVSSSDGGGAGKSAKNGKKGGAGRNDAAGGDQPDRDPQ